MAERLPVAGDYVIVSVFGDKVGAIAAKGHVETAQKSDGKAKLLSIEEALKKDLKRMKEDLGIKTIMRSANPNLYIAIRPILRVRAD